MMSIIMILEGNLVVRRVLFPHFEVAVTDVTARAKCEIFFHATSIFATGVDVYQLLVRRKRLSIMFALPRRSQYNSCLEYLHRFYLES